MKQEHQLIYSALQAMWWMHAASNGHSEVRQLYHGISGPSLTPSEKRDDAMETAQRHIAMFEAVAEDIHANPECTWRRTGQAGGTENGN